MHCYRASVAKICRLYLRVSFSVIVPFFLLGITKNDCGSIGNTDKRTWRYTMAIKPRLSFNYFVSDALGVVPLVLMTSINALETTGEWFLENSHLELGFRQLPMRPGIGCKQSAQDLSPGYQSPSFFSSFPHRFDRQRNGFGLEWAGNQRIFYTLHASSPPCAALDFSIVLSNASLGLCCVADISLFARIISHHVHVCHLFFESTTWSCYGLGLGCTQYQNMDNKKGLELLSKAIIKAEGDLHERQKHEKALEQEFRKAQEDDMENSSKCLKNITNASQNLVLAQQVCHPSLCGFSRGVGSGLGRPVSHDAGMRALTCICHLELGSGQSRPLSASLVCRLRVQGPRCALDELWDVGRPFLGLGSTSHFTGIYCAGSSSPLTASMWTVTDVEYGHHAFH